jgi:hypothetical protein
MVRGIDRFRDYFKDQTDKYVMIGGTACDIAMSRMGLDFRATKDLDIVLVVEAVDAEFGRVFWEFVKKGQYQNKQKSTGKSLFYRFDSPKDDTFPYMLELFARKPDILDLSPDSHLTPIPIDEQISSLSAILLDDEYYDFIVRNKSVADGLPLILQQFLIPLKAKAYLDLWQIKNDGGSIDNKDLKKHKNDVFRLYQILSGDVRVALPEAIASDLSRFLDQMADDPPDLKNLGIKQTTMDTILANLKTVYNI